LASEGKGPGFYAAFRAWRVTPKEDSISNRHRHDTGRGRGY
jgi:hypothetical protein